MLRSPRAPVRPCRSGTSDTVVLLVERRLPLEANLDGDAADPHLANTRCVLWARKGTTGQTVRSSRQPAGAPTAAAATLAGHSEV
jgi:hypothetical protein